MTRLVMPDKHCKGINVEGAHTGVTTRYSPGRDATVEVTNPQHERALREAGCFPANLGGLVRTSGFPCSCGHQSLFRICSKCGQEN